MRAKFVSESVNFERGQDPIKAMGLGNVRPYPSMSAEEFKDWFEREIRPYIDRDMMDNISDNLSFNDWESDEEITGYMVSSDRLSGIMNIDIVRELVKMREYFNDKKYIDQIFSGNIKF